MSAESGGTGSGPVSAHPAFDRWEPLTPGEVSEVMRGFAAPWWIAGGWAIELDVGHAFRHHDDVDVLVLRTGHTRLHDVLAGWELWAADPPGTLRPWLPGERLPVTVHDVWCRHLGSSGWQLQFMIDESEQDEWVSRRDSRVRAPIDRIGCRTPDGLPYLAPEIQLYYKAKNRRAKDETDFVTVLPTLSDEQCAWLDEVLRQTVPGHPWRRALSCVATNPRSSRLGVPYPEPTHPRSPSTRGVPTGKTQYPW